MSKLTYLTYSNIYSNYAGGPESTAIIEALREVDGSLRVIALDKKEKKDQIVTPIPIGLRYILPRVLSKLEILLNGIYSARYINERILDYFSKNKIDKNNIFVTSALCFSTLKNSKKLGNINVFYAKNSFDFYEIVNSENEKWKYRVNKGEELYLQKYNNIVNFIDYFIVLTDKDREILINKYGVCNKQIFNIKLGVDVAKYEDVNKQYKNDKVKYGFLGTAPIRKGLPYLLEAWKQNNSIEDQLIIAGLNKKDIDFFNTRWKDIKNIEYRGVVETKEFFKEIDVYITTSLAEGQPRTTMEAMASGLPCICSNRGCTKDIINNKNALIIKDKDIESLKYSIEKIKESEIRKSLGKAAREIAISKYLSKDFTLQFKNIILDIIKDREEANG